MVRSHCSGLVTSPKLATSRSVMNLSPVPVSTRTRLSRSSPISNSARGRSVCSCPVNVAGPPSVWKRRVSTPESVRLRAMFLKAVKYSGVAVVMVSSSVVTRDAALSCAVVSGGSACEGQRHRTPRGCAVQFARLFPAVTRRPHILVPGRLEIERQPCCVGTGCGQLGGQRDDDCVGAPHLFSRPFAFRVRPIARERCTDSSRLLRRRSTPIGFTSRMGTGVLTCSCIYHACAGDNGILLNAGP